ncbi:MAG: HigA family addiction module antitoxin [Thermomicrobiales bacterium]
MATRIHEPIHPGEILREDVLEELGLSARQVAEILDVPANRISQIVSGKRAITADTALRLSAWLGTTPAFWLGLQTDYDLEMAREEVGQAIAKRITPRDPGIVVNPSMMPNK